MNKCVKLFLLIFISIVLVGCEKKEQVDESLVKINGLEFHLNKESEFKELKYNTIEEFRELTFDNYVQYDYRQEDGKNLLFFRVFYYQNKDNEYARGDLAIEENLEYVSGKTDNIEYKLIDTKRTDGTIHFYFINKDKDTYVIHLVSQYDIKDFEDKVIKLLHF